jgi:RNA polymerase sigma factor (sigma-70 family)
MGTSEIVLRLISRAQGPTPEGAEASVRRIDDLAPLLALCRRGGTDATRTLLHALGPSMLQMIRRVLGPRHPDVDDVLQEAFIGLLRALPSFRGDSTTRHFACRIATLSALKARRSRARKLEEQGSGLDEECWGQADPHDWVRASSRRQLLRQLLDALPSPQAEAMVLHCVAGMTVEEIAAAVRCPSETIRSRLRLAKAMLRERAAADPAMAELLEDSP